MELLFIFMLLSVHWFLSVFECHYTCSHQGYRPWDAFCFITFLNWFHSVQAYGFSRLIALLDSCKETLLRHVKIYNCALCRLCALKKKISHSCRCSCDFHRNVFAIGIYKCSLPFLPTCTWKYIFLLILREYRTCPLIECKLSVVHVYTGIDKHHEFRLHLVLRTVFIFLL